MALKGKILGKRVWTNIAKNARDMYREEIFDKGKNVYGGKWWGGSYSDEYRTAKATGGIKRQAEAYKNKVTAVLTGETMKDVEGHLKVKRNGFEIGYPSMGGRVASLRRRKPRDGALTTKDKPLPDKVSKYIRNAYSKAVGKSLKPKTRVHKGKK